MNIASYIANSQTAPASTELGTAQLQLVIICIFEAQLIQIKRNKMEFEHDLGPAQSQLVRNINNYTISKFVIVVKTDSVSGYLCLSD